MGGIDAGGASVDTDTLPTKEIFYQFPESGVLGGAGNYGVRYLPPPPDADNDTAMTIHIPHDFLVLVSLTLLWGPRGTGGYRFRIDYDWGLAGQPYNANTATHDTGPIPGAVTIIEEVNIFPIPPIVWAPNSYVGVRVTNIGAIQGPTHLYGIRMRYL